ncbi:hypothetical protein LDENG_00080170, partial [Lucifuga dentata]
LQLRLISKVRPFLSFSDLKEVIHAFITSRLDYCNALYFSISKKNIHRLQIIQNAAAQLKALHGQAPIHICDLLTPYEPDRCLRSSDRNLLIVPESHLVTSGDWAFAVCAPELWN